MFWYVAVCAWRPGRLGSANTGCLKINETHKIADKYVDFNPIFCIFQI